MTARGIAVFWAILFALGCRVGIGPAPPSDAPPRLTSYPGAGLRYLPFEPESLAVRPAIQERLRALHPGRSTREDVLALLGRPNHWGQLHPFEGDPPESVILNISAMGASSSCLGLALHGLPPCEQMDWLYLTAAPEPGRDREVVVLRFRGTVLEAVHRRHLAVMYDP